MRIAYTALEPLDPAIMDHPELLDADMWLVDGHDVVFHEFHYGVVELAAALLHWIDSADGSDFDFASMDWAEVGTVRVLRHDGGWRFGSCLTPEVSRILPWAEVERCVRAFAADIEADLRTLGIDPAPVLFRHRA